MILAFGDEIVLNPRLEIGLQNQGRTYLVHISPHPPVLPFHAALDHGSLCHLARKSLVNITDLQIRKNGLEPGCKLFYVGHNFRIRATHLSRHSNNDFIHLFFGKILFQVVDQSPGFNSLQGRCNDLQTIGYGKTCSFQTVVDGNYSSHKIWLMDHP